MSGRSRTAPRPTGRGSRHKFDRPGVYNVRLSVKDNTDQDRAVDYDEAKVVINAAPVARAGPDVRAAPGDAVTFDAGNSFDPDGGTLTYRWDFSDQAEPSFARQVVRAYAAPGVYNAQLTVTDDSGAVNAVDRDEVEIRINHQPVASPGSDITTWQTTITFDGSASADADGDALTYRWDFGDGTPSGEGAVVSHTYADGGVYPVTLTVNDGTGLWNASASAVGHGHDQPAAGRRGAGGNKEVCAGDVVVFDGSGSQDPDGGLLRYHWDFGDGGKADIVNPTRTFTKGAVYPVTLTVQDESGFPNDRDISRIVVKVDESPLASAGPDQEVCAGTEVHFDGSGVARLRRRGQPLHLGLRRRRDRRRRQAGARLQSARRLSGAADHRGRPGRAMRQYQHGRDARQGGRGAGRQDRRAERDRGRGGRDASMPASRPAPPARSGAGAGTSATVPPPRGRRSSTSTRRPAPMSSA